MTSEGPAMTDAPANVPEDMERILSVADDADARELRSRLEAREAANALVSKSPTSGNVRSADMASRSFQDCLGRLLQKYFGHGQVFANRTEAWRWLQAQGYSIQKTSVYNHARKGLLKLQQDGSILLRDLEHYAATHLEKLANKGPEDMDREVARRKAKADADRAEAEADRARVKADLAQGRVIDKGILVQTLAAVVG
ncbi:MAG: hypothetical protein EOM25_13100, partial [Deltaproteobacteria bacterium]|nr:hypothetical protein [Deltaproteobacteria bacterium]